jgi:hypothetical protein
LPDLVSRSGNALDQQLQASDCGDGEPWKKDNGPAAECLQAPERFRGDHAVSGIMRKLAETGCGAVNGSPEDGNHTTSYEAGHQNDERSVFEPGMIKEFHRQCRHKDHAQS